MITLQLQERDVARLISSVRHKRKKVEHGIDKFRGNFDTTLGKNMIEGQRAFAALEKQLMEAMSHAQENHPRSAGRDPA